MSTVDCHMWFHIFIHELKLIESGSLCSKRARIFQGNYPFDLFVAKEKYEICIIKFADILIKNLEADVREQLPPAQRHISASNVLG